MTWGCANQYLVSQLKLWELLTHHECLFPPPLPSSPLLSSPLLPVPLASSPLLPSLLLPLPPISSQVHCFWTAPAVTFHPCLPNDLISPFTSLHTSYTSLSPVSRGIMGLRTRREKGRLGLVSFWLLCLLSPSPLSASFPRSLFPLSLCLSLYVLVTPLGFVSLYLCQPDCNPHKQCCSLFTLMCRLGPDGAGYVQGILMAVGGED